MKSWIALGAVFLLTWVASADALARDTKHLLPVKAVLENPKYASQLSGVAFYFGDTAHPAIQESFGEYRTNKKTNAFGKSDQNACEWVFLSALLSLRERARSLGANAVVNIQSNYRDQPYKSDTQYECGAGDIMAGSALIGTIVSVK